MSTRLEIIKSAVPEPVHHYQFGKAKSVHHEDMSYFDVEYLINSSLIMALIPTPDLTADRLNFPTL